jgi:hypothetical protein
MKNLLSSLLLAGAMASGWAATTINLTNNFSHGANVGWMNWRGNTTQGAVIGEYVCADSIYGANVGWISLGNGMPSNGVQYLNLSADDYGVNHDGFGNLRGYAYGANIGWIRFESLGAPTVDLNTGLLSGYAYAANCGWISLSNEFAFVQTDIVAEGADSDGDGLADAWERNHFGGLVASSYADADGDWVNNLQEYLAGTNPNDGADKLAITTYAVAPGGAGATVGWQSVPTRRYTIEKTLDLISPRWMDSGLGLIVPDGATTTRTFADPNAPMRFYRVRAVRPLSP